MLKTFSLILFWSVMLYSCKEVSFTEAQPKGVAPLKEIPPALRGVYQTFDKTTGEFSDTLIVESWGYHFKDKNDKDWLNRGTISDTLVIKFYQNYYFINFKSEGQWVLRLVQQEPSGAIRFMSIDLKDEVKRKEVLKKLGKKLTIKEIKRKDDTFYQINPSPEQLMALIKEGFFTGERLNKVK
ncbi:MAG: hypothetical protein HYZ44_07750 [Bacteroidetes bacterium]|nr:hypothetical protein [Bacteroidota bacterium]